MAKTLTPREKIKIKRLAIGDRAYVSGQVLRVLGGEGKPLLILLDDSSVKIIVHSHWVAEGENVHGGDAVTLNGTVTRIGDLVEIDPHSPISLSIDGYTQSRVTLPARAIGRTN